MALTEKDITVAGVNTMQYLNLVGYVMYCYQEYENYATIHVDPINTPIDELRRRIVHAQNKLVLIIPKVAEHDEDDELEVTFYSDDAEAVKAREMELRKIFRSCFITDLVPVEKEITNNDELLSSTVALKFHAQGIMVKIINN